MISSSSVEACTISNVQSQVTIESVNSHQVINQFSRLDFINSQLMNRYSASDLAPFVVHIESKSESENVGNLHPMKLGKLLADKFSFYRTLEELEKILFLSSLNTDMKLIHFLMVRTYFQIIRLVIFRTLNCIGLE